MNSSHTDCDGKKCSDGSLISREIESLKEQGGKLCMGLIGSSHIDHVGVYTVERQCIVIDICCRGAGKCQRSDLGGQLMIEC